MKQDAWRSRSRETSEAFHGKSPNSHESGYKNPSRRWVAYHSPVEDREEPIVSNQFDVPIHAVSQTAYLTDSENTDADSTASPVESQSHAAAAEVDALSLSQMCELAISNNPDLITLRQSERVSRAAQGVAETYPFNPFVQVQATPFQDPGNGGPNRMYHYVLLMQTIQLAHQQDFREQGAKGVLNSTRWNIHQAELLALAQAQRLYFTALYLHGVDELAETSHENNLQLLEILENQLNAGEVTAADVAIVRVDTASTRQQRQLASANFQNALRDLARHVGMQPSSLHDIAGDLEQFRWQLPNIASQNMESSQDEWDHAVLNSTNSIVEWAKSRPDVMAARSDVDVARAGLGLACASKTPDLQVGPYYQSTADTSTFFGFRAQMDLPILNNGEPLERQRLAEYHQRITGWNQAQRRAELDALAAMDRYADTLVAIQLNTSDQLSSDLPTALKGLEKQFLAGEVDIVRVVQARNSLILNRRARLDLLNELAQATATLVGATGISFESLLQINSPSDERSEI